MTSTRTRSRCCGAPPMFSNGLLSPRNFRPIFAVTWFTKCTFSLVVSVAESNEKRSQNLEFDSFLRNNCVLLPKCGCFGSQEISPICSFKRYSEPKIEL